MIDKESTHWAQLGAGVRLRQYQKRAVDQLLAALGQPGSRICLVAPPGAGKTHCALHVAVDLECPLEVRVPTTALVLQWQDRVASVIVALEPGADPPVNVTTYAADAGLPEGALVVLDEAHHLGGAWGQRLLDQLGPTHRVLGLTGTPPQGSSGWERFVEVVGSRPVEIQAPPLVRDGHLCPFVDLVWPVIADMDDVPELTAADGILAAAERTLEPELLPWIDRRLEEDLWELTEERFVHNKGLLVALCRARQARGRSLPADLPIDGELSRPLTLNDRVQLLWAFDRERPVVRQAVRGAGFRAAGRGLVLKDDVAFRSLATSGCRVRGLVQLLAIEARARSEYLRALVLTDRDVEGSRLSARQVLHALVNDPVTDELDPILVTGKAFWVDDDLWPRVQPLVPGLPSRRSGDHNEVDISGWPTSQRVAFATRLLTDGITRCLVGTRHLLGEGWDCPVVNCVVDLTGIAAPVTVNQVRGRALRQDPGDPGKVASLWEVVPLIPGVQGGDRMLKRLALRHEHTLGIDDQGRIRAGLDRIDPILEEDVVRVAEQTGLIRQHMIERVEHMDQVIPRWSVGKEYVDRHSWRFQAPPSPPAARVVRVARPPQRPLPPGRLALVSRRRRRGRAAFATAAGGLTASVLAGGIGSAAAVGLVGSLPIAAAIGAAITIPLATTTVLATGWLTYRRWADRDIVGGAILALDAALRETGQINGTLRQQGEHRWLDGEPEQSRRFAEAAAELLGPVRYPRYVLLEGSLRVWPVPATLGGDRTTADCFARAWSQQVGSCQVIFARQGKGRELLVQAWRAGGQQPVQIMEIWE